jgi:hypothetical protein
VYTRQDGSAGTSFEVNANTVRFLSSKGEGEGESFPAPEHAAGEEEIPF